MAGEWSGEFDSAMDQSDLVGNSLELFSNQVIKVPIVLSKCQMKFRVIQSPEDVWL